MARKHSQFTHRPTKLSWLDESPNHRDPSTIISNGEGEYINNCLVSRVDHLLWTSLSLCRMTSSDQLMNLGSSVPKLLAVLVGGWTIRTLVAAPNVPSSDSNIVAANSRVERTITFLVRTLQVCCQWSLTAVFFIG